MDNHRTASARKPGCHCQARSTWPFLLMVVITPTASYSGSNVLQSRARPADAGPGPTPPAFTGVTEPPKRGSAIKVTPPRAFYLASLRLKASPFLLMAEKKDQSSHGALPNRERGRPSEFCND